MSDAVLRLNAALEGRYEIESEIGEGGMATVFLAKDLKHKRKVALKVLKPELAAVVGAERFLAEIETTANLQHPHILPLFDSGEADSFLFYVMPFVEGETLRERIDRERQLPVDEAVRIATAVAGALQHAHDRGVIHRDIKPGNILIQAGQPVVADFGIALAVGSAGGARLTETGLSVGTPFYMSPEQATGDQGVGPGTDIYAVGAVLYEMLVGDPPYMGSTAQAVLGKIIQGVPVSATEVRRSVPANVDAAIRKALEKLPADRFTGAQDFARALADPGFRHGEGMASIAGSAGLWNPLSVAASALVVALGIALGWTALRPDPPARVAWFASPFEAGQEPVGGGMELTADGSALVYTGPGSDGEGTQLWIRRWGSLSSTPVPGTEGARNHSLAQIAFSPDGREVAFTPGGGVPLRVVPLEGGPSRTLVESAWAASGWSDDGWVYFQDAGTGVQRVRDAGGESEVLTERSEGEVFHTVPRLLPNGKGVVFQVLRSQSGVESEVWVVDVETRERTMLVLGNSPRYVATGHLLFGTDDGRLMAAPFDVDPLEMTGPAVPVAEGLTNSGQRGNVLYTVSQDGTLLFWAGERRSPGGRELVVVDLDGNQRALSLTPRDFSRVVWAPDGRSVAYDSDDGGGVHVFVYDVELGTLPRQITYEGANRFPVFSPDGTRLVFTRWHGVAGDLYVKNLLTNEPPRLLMDLDGNQLASGWPTDSVIVFADDLGPGTPGNLGYLDLSDPENPREVVYLTAEHDLHQMTVSPDGTLAAYTSDEAGVDDIYLASFPVPGQKTRVTRGGGNTPYWAPDGNTLFYETGGAERSGWFIAARLQREPAPVVLRLDSLFANPGATRPPPGAIHPDGDRFILARAAGAPDPDEVEEAERMILVQNFFEMLRARVGN